MVDILWFITSKYDGWALIGAYGMHRGVARLFKMRGQQGGLMGPKMAALHRPLYMYKEFFIWEGLKGGWASD